MNSAIEIIVSAIVFSFCIFGAVAAGFISGI